MLLAQNSILNPQLKLLLYEEGSRMIFHSVTLTSQPIVVKIGASSLHTIISSTLIWMQVLKAYFGDVVDISRNHFQYEAKPIMQTFLSSVG